MLQKLINRTSLLCLLLLSSGCTALLLGGAAAGGYVVGKDERPAGVILDDSTITASVKTRLAADKYVKALRMDVDTWEGVVTLHGTVSSYIERNQAEKIASSVNGVKGVNNKLKVDTE